MLSSIAEIEAYNNPLQVGRFWDNMDSFVLICLNYSLVDNPTLQLGIMAFSDAANEIKKLIAVCYKARRIVCAVTLPTVALLVTHTANWVRS